jgi:hypothetical protein
VTQLRIIEREKEQGIKKLEKRVKQLEEEINY